MKVLALETATIAGSVAILDDAVGLIGEVRVNVKVAHAERLMPSIDWLLRSSQLSIRDIDVFALSIGPGSFTGLRIGLSTAKGFAYAAGRPLVAVPTLDAFARTLPFCSHLMCPVLDARKNEVYAGLYKWEDTGCVKVMPETAMSPESLVQNITGPVVFTGEGAEKYREMISGALASNAIFAPPSKMTPSAAAVAEIAIEKFSEGATADPESLVPFYIRKSEAEIKWQASL